MRGRILVVDDEANTAELLAESLRQRGYAADGLTSARACLERLASSSAASGVVLMDVMMPEMSGIELCSAIRDRYPDVLPIVVTGRSDTDVAIAAIRAGAYDYITKPVAIRALELALIRALEHLALQQELARLRDASADDPVSGVEGDSSAIQNTLEMVRRIASTDATVLITGESGTGKERIARAIHHLSDRRHERFIAINCGAMPVPLLESELFGHVRGAFTGATRGRIGLFLQAAHGTILLDEVGDMPLEMQAKLLRVLQERSVRPVGGSEEMPLFARVMAATNRRLEDDVAARRFREDLYHRINVIAIPVPPLRDRQEDILPMAHRMLRRCAARLGKDIQGITPHAARLLLEYDWPGNVRELENCMERAVALCRFDQITVDALPEKLHLSSAARFVIAGSAPEDVITLTEMRLRYVRKVLALCDGNKSLAARILGIDRRTISHQLDHSAHASDDR
jgi:two-component system response regulator HydG